MKTELPHYRRLLNEALVERIEKNPSYSLRALAKFLEIESSALSQIIRGIRFLSEKRARNILERLNIAPDEQELFLLSLAEARVFSGKKRMTAQQRLRLKTQQKSNLGPSADLSGEIFRTISDWYHYAILELTRISCFQDSPEWIAGKLNISVPEVNLALERLYKLELLERVDGTLVKTNAYIETANKGITTSALRKRQKQIILKSLYSLENDPINIRNHSARTVAIDIQKIDLAKNRIEKFMIQLCDELASENPTEVYELSIQLFPLTNQKLN